MRHFGAKCSILEHFAALRQDFGQQSQKKTGVLIREMRGFASSPGSAPQAAKEGGAAARALRPRGSLRGRRGGGS